MKKAYLVLAAVGLSFTTLADTISIRADEWYPMNGDPSGDKKGFMIDIADKILTANGHNLDYKIMPWERALDTVRKGEADCVVGAYIDDAPDFVFPSENWGMDSTAVFVEVSDDYKLNGMASLAGRKVGVIGGYAYFDELDEMIKNDDKTFKSASGGDALETNIKKLTGKRLDTVIESPAVMRAKLKELALTDKVKMVGLLEEDSPIYIACSPAKPGSKQLVGLFDEGLSKIRASGELEAIMSQYGMSDWK
jgi:polar amino acid transport system substrate-binding protein